MDEENVLKQIKLRLGEERASQFLCLLQEIMKPSTCARCGNSVPENIPEHGIDYQTLLDIADDDWGVDDIETPLPKNEALKDKSKFVVSKTKKRLFLDENDPFA